MRRSGMVDPALSGVAETLLIPLYNRAMESQRLDAIMKDEKAVALVTQLMSDVSIRYNFDQPEPRMKPFRWVAPIFRLFKPMRIFHFQLGEVAG